MRHTWARAQRRTERIELVAVGRRAAVVGHVLAATGVTRGPRPSPASLPSRSSRRTSAPGWAPPSWARCSSRPAGRGWPLLLLLGDPAYYERFGFVPAATRGIHYAPAGRDSPHFLVRFVGDQKARPCRAASTATAGSSEAELLGVGARAGQLERRRLNALDGPEAQLRALAVDG